MVYTGKIDKVVIPSECPFCGGEVVYTSNAALYGREYGNGKCYMCRKCHASTGTHPHPNEQEALGVLANKEMKELKKQCHALLDPIWKGETRVMSRGAVYRKLARRMHIPMEACHVGHFDTARLKQALEILNETGWYEGKGVPTEVGPK